MISEAARTNITQCELPCGFVGEDDRLLRKVQIREMTGEEEDILASNLSALDKTEKIVTNCILNFDGVIERGKIAQMVRQLPGADRAYLILAIRRATNGDIFRFQTSCPSCKQEQTKVVNLAELTVKPPEDPKKRVYEVKTPRGRTVEMKVFTGEEEHKAAQLKSKMKDELLTLALHLRVQKIDGNPATVEMLKQLPSPERQFLRQIFNKYEAGLETEVDADCSSCGVEFKVDVDVSDSNFFFPSEISKP